MPERLALRRVTISPLGVARHDAPSAAGVAVLPLLAGFAWLGYLAAVGHIVHRVDSTVQAIAYLSDILVMMGGARHRRTVADHARLPLRGSA